MLELRPFQQNLLSLIHSLKKKKLREFISRAFPQKWAKTSGFSKVIWSYLPAPIYRTSAAEKPSDMHKLE
jgi:hypothetical protein